MSLNKFVFTHGYSVSNGCVCMKSSVCILAGDESRHLVSSRLPRIHHMRSQAVPVSIYILLSMKRSRTRSRVTTSQASEVYILLGVKRSRTRLGVTIYILLSTKRPRPRPRDLRTPQPTTSCCKCRQQRLLRPSTPACVNPTT